MRVFPLGVGPAFARRFFNTNLIVELDDSDFLLVDCGITASRSLDTIGMSVLDVNTLFVSHLRADHIGGIEELAPKAKLVRDAKVALYVQEQLVDALCSFNNAQRVHETIRTCWRIATCSTSCTSFITRITLTGTGQRCCQLRSVSVGDLWI